MAQRVAIRADASSLIGTGHIFRSIAIFEGWRDRGVACLFVCSDVPGNMIGGLKAMGFEAVAIPATTDQVVDATAFCAAVRRWGGADIVWVDHYALDARWENHARTVGGILCVIDDLANRRHSCDLLVDSSHGADERQVYRNLLQNDDSVCLIGTDYVPLRKQFTEHMRIVPDHPSHVKCVLVTLGGNDPVNASTLVLDAIDCPELSQIAFRMTVGSANPRADELLARGDMMPNVSMLYQHHDMVGLMAWADLCIGAGGTTSWERCYMGLPTLGLTLADNQSTFIERLERLGVARHIGWANLISVRDLRAAIVNSVGDIAWRTRASTVGFSLIDGQGVNRITETMQAVYRQRTA
ncbi:UDP-2,4-diacetamido-2,4,6-trideoxy-beta-L-altropyranose hydrolase [Cognatiyoonia sp. IB215446]|uniref:UDP-2,4-diacetamido-2,4, 6-trideoxy-beta-L-altropyranose hydrolase n=1 Tax=Cognatiyoonia sp. IB215446 TaxID=3097355 RepID=UPI002A11865E|nr:UDP-2,4-diacetamido-2,4,6-trideoxy-beta-L-altropyranose hydrolase [Cognatiyoonia sp. IB215446]MDX8349288.1 UDP-2,4-diacetamido-2,4,6-trideoxy-beta-L-altropyranose hydrolase [Cognatiyoonia sp. IB215446]